MQSRHLFYVLTVGIVTILGFFYFVNPNRLPANVAYTGVRRSFLFDEPNVNSSIEGLSKDYRFAKDYYRSIGYSVCDSLSKTQLDKHFWMSLRINQPCGRYFDDFLSLMLLPSGPWPPPKTVPPELRLKYFLDGRITRESLVYFAQKYNGEAVPHQWSPEYVGEFVKKADLKADFPSYGSDTQHIYHVLKVFPLHNKTGIVIGSESPWVEAILLSHGRVKKIVTVEYHLINSTVPQIEYVHPTEFNRDWQKWSRQQFDFVFTYSSLEHSGLGRYGDRLDPNGDLKDLHKLSCILPPGALVFLGIPVGFDKIEWNAHRIYGQWRLPLITANYEVLGMYKDYEIKDPMRFLRQQGYHHAIIVLRNAKNNLCQH